MEHKGTCLLETDRLYLGRFTMKDVHAVYENWAKDPHVTKFLSWPTHIDPELTRKILLEWIESYLKSDLSIWPFTVFWQKSMRLYQNLIEKRLITVLKSSRRSIRLHML